MEAGKVLRNSCSHILGEIYHVTGDKEEGTDLLYFWKYIRVNEIVGIWDKGKESGTMSCMTHLSL